MTILSLPIGATVLIGRPIQDLVPKPQTPSTIRPGNSAPKDSQERKPDVDPKSELKSSPQGTRCDPTQQEHLDVTANLEGNVKFNGRESKGSLQIADHGFTLKVDENTTLKGQASATKTCGYTALALTFDKESAAILKAANTPELGISLLARQCGNGLMLTAAPGEDSTFVFKESSANRGCGGYCPRPPCTRRPRAARSRVESGNSP
jgi:hypothetical protein